MMLLLSCDLYPFPELEVPCFMPRRLEPDAAVYPRYPACFSCCRCCCWLSQVYEQNIHTTMKQMPAQRERRKKDYERVLTLFSSDSFAKDKRTKVSTEARELFG